MNLPLILNILSGAVFLTAFIWLIVHPGFTSLKKQITLPLLFALCFYFLISLSNIFEHSEISFFLDPLEDVSEVIFILLFFSFINNWDSVYSLKSAREKEQWLFSTIESLADGVITTNSKGKITFINNEIKLMTGINLNEAKGKMIPDLFTFYDKNTMKEIEFSPVRDILKELFGDSFGREIYVKVNNNYLRLIVKTSKIINKKNKVLGTVTVFHDVSEYYSLLDQINHSRKMEAMGQLAGGVAHDFNNMLGAIMGAAEMLKENKENTQIRNFDKLISIIINAVNNAKELTGNLLAFGRKGKLLSTAISFNRVISGTVAIAERTIDKQISIKLNLPKSNLKVVGDPSLLENMLLNLIINAADAQPNGGEISIRVSKKTISKEEINLYKGNVSLGEYIELVVEDRGDGIKPEIIEKVFEPFFTTKEEGKGTGLGLAAVYGAVINHNGAIRIINKPNRGCRFEILLPETGLSETHDLSLNEEKKISNNKITLLVIDDEPLIRSTTKLMLTENGHECLTAQSGEEGIELLKKFRDKIDIILLDMIMPKMNGNKIFKIMKTISPETPVIIASGFTKNEKVPKAAEGFLRKPFHQRELFKAIDDSLGNIK